MTQSGTLTAVQNFEDVGCHLNIAGVADRQEVEMLKKFNAFALDKLDFFARGVGFEVN